MQHHWPSGDYSNGVKELTSKLMERMMILMRRLRSNNHSCLLQLATACYTSGKLDRDLPNTDLMINR
jgi:hypothetical protein